MNIFETDDLYVVSLKFMSLSVDNLSFKTHVVSLLSFSFIHVFLKQTYVTLK